MMWNIITCINNIADIIVGGMKSITNWRPDKTAQKTT